MDPHELEDELMEGVFTGFRTPRPLSCSPGKSPTKSPWKGTSVSSVNNAFMDESSVDIYGDLSMDSIHVDVEGADAGEDQTKVTDEKQDKAEVNESIDLFTNSHASDLSEKDKVQKRIKELEEQNRQLLIENKSLQQCKEQASKNMSSLFLTAKSELQQKDEEIRRLQKLVQELRQRVTTRDQEATARGYVSSNIEQSQSSPSAPLSQRLDSASTSSHLKRLSEKRCGREGESREQEKDRSQSKYAKLSDKSSRKNKTHSIESVRDCDRNIIPDKRSRNSISRSHDGRDKSLHQLEENSVKKSDKERKRSVIGSEKATINRSLIDSDIVLAESEKIVDSAKSSRETHRSRDRNERGTRSDRERNRSEGRRREGKLHTPVSEKSSYPDSISYRASNSTSIFSRYSKNHGREENVERHTKDQSVNRQSNKISVRDSISSYSDRNNSNNNSNDLNDQEKDWEPQRVEMIDQSHNEKRSLSKNDLRAKLLQKRKSTAVKVVGSDRVVSSHNAATIVSKEKVSDRNNQQQEYSADAVSSVVGDVLESPFVKAGQTNIKDRDENCHESKKKGGGKASKKKEVIVKEMQDMVNLQNLKVKDLNRYETSVTSKTKDLYEGRRGTNTEKDQDDIMRKNEEIIKGSREEMRPEDNENSRKEVTLEDSDNRRKQVTLEDSDNKRKAMRQVDNQNGSKISKNIKEKALSSDLDVINDKATRSKSRQLDSICQRLAAHLEHDNSPSTKLTQLKESEPFNYQDSEITGQKESSCKDISDSESSNVSEIRMSSGVNDNFHAGESLFSAENNMSASSERTITKSNISKENVSEAVDFNFPRSLEPTKSCQSSHFLEGVPGNSSQSLRLAPFEVNEGKFRKTIGSSGSVLDKSTDSECVLMISEDASFHEEASPTCSPGPKSDIIQPVIKAGDCFSGYKEKCENDNPKQKNNQDSVPSTFLGNQSTCATISKQDLFSAVSNASLPFTNLIEDTNNSNAVKEKTFSGNPSSPSNQTFPFKVTESSQSSVVVNSRSSSCTSSSLCTPVNVSNSHKRSPTRNQSKNMSNKSKAGDMRAFPITDFLSDKTESPPRPKLPVPAIIISGDKSDHHSLDADLMGDESSNGKSNGSQGAASNTTITSSESNNSHTENLSNSNSLMDGHGNQETSKYVNVVSEQSLADNANLTPPRIGKRHPSCTPTKLRQSLFTPKTSKSDNIMCTPNLIVLGDEEATSGTLISPCKPHLTPSEFYPPGVRMNLEQVSTHRHIRGEPELLHASFGDRPGQIQGPKRFMEIATIEQSSSESSSANIVASGGMKNTEGQVESSECTSNETVQSEKEGATMNQIIEQSSSPEQPYSSNASSGVSNEDILQREGKMLSMVKNAFVKVFKINYQAFKAEMAEKADRDKQLLRSTLEQSFGRVLRGKKVRVRKISGKGFKSKKMAQSRVDSDSFKDNGKKSRKQSVEVMSKKMNKSCNEQFPSDKGHQNPGALHLSNAEEAVVPEVLEINTASQSPNLQDSSMPCRCGSLCTGLCTIDSPPLEEISKDPSPSILGSQDRDSTSHSNIALAHSHSPQKETSCFRFYLFPGMTGSNNNLPASSTHITSNHKQASSVCCNEDTTNKSRASSPQRNREDELIHDIVSSLDTCWQEVIDKDFRETSVFHSQLSLPSSRSTLSKVQFHQGETSNKDLSFASKIPFTQKEDNRTLGETQLVHEKEPSNTKSSFSSTSQIQHKVRKKGSPTACHNGEKEKQQPILQKPSMLEAAHNSSPDVCTVTSSDVRRRETKKTPHGRRVISPFGTEEPDSTSEPFPHSIHDKGSQQCKSGKRKTAEFTSVQRRESSPNKIISFEQECDRLDLPDSPQRETPARMKRMETSTTPTASRRQILTRGDKMSVPRGSLMTLKNQLFPKSEEGDLSESPGKTHVRRRRKIRQNSASKCPTADKDRSNQEEPVAESPVKTSKFILRLSKCNFEESSSLNTTFTIRESQSDEDDQSSTNQGDLETKSEYESNSSYSSSSDSSGEEIPPSIVPSPRRRYIPPPDELSLEAKSLSEFDQDMFNPRARQMVPLHSSSRTASFSSLLSVGHDSPVSVSSHRFSTPSSHRSPRDAFMSPYQHRVLDSCDEGAMDVFDVALVGTKPTKNSQKMSEKSAIEKASSDTKLSRHIPYCELKKMKLAKRRTLALSDTDSESDIESSLPVTPKPKLLQSMPKEEPFSHKPTSQWTGQSLGLRDEDYLSPRKKVKRVVETNLHRSTSRREPSVMKRVKTPMKDRENQENHSQKSDVRMSRKSEFESPKKLFKSNYRSLSESSYSSEDTINEEDKLRQSNHSLDTSLSQNSEEFSAEFNTLKSKKQNLRKSVRIVELSPMAHITAGSPCKSGERTNFMLKRLCTSPRESCRDNRQSPSCLKSPRSVTKSCQTKLNNTVERSSVGLSTDYSKSRDHGQTTGVPRPRGGLSEIDRKRKKQMAEQADVDQEVLSWTIAHQKNVNKVKMKLDDRLNETLKQCDNVKEKDFRKLQSTCTENLRSTCAESNNQLNMASDLESHLEVNQVQSEDVEDGEILDESIDDKEDDDGEADGTDDTLVPQDDDSDSAYKRNPFSSDGEIIESHIRRGQKPIVPRSSEVDHSSDRSDPTKPKKPMPTRRRKNFVQKSDSGHKTSLLDQAHHPSPIKKSRYGEISNDDTGRAVGGRRKKWQSPSPLKVGNSRTNDSPLRRRRSSSLREREWERQRSLSFDSDRGIEEDERGRRRHGNGSKQSSRNKDNHRTATARSISSRDRDSRERVSPENQISREYTDTYRPDRRKKSVDEISRVSKFHGRSHRTERDRRSPVRDRRRRSRSGSFRWNDDRGPRDRRSPDRRSRYTDQRPQNVNCDEGRTRAISTAQLRRSRESPE